MHICLIPCECESKMRSLNKPLHAGWHCRREAVEDISSASSSFYSSDTDSDASGAADRDVESNVDISRASSSFYSPDTDSNASSAADRDVGSNAGCHEMDSPTPSHG